MASLPEPYTGRTIQLSGSRFVDAEGRSLLLRGINLGGSTKMPATPNGASHLPDSLADPARVSFVGRPFPLAEADAHFARLRSWGLTFLRFLVTWEAIEHAGPGIYDTEYLDYLHAVVQKAGEYGISLFIDPHQDVWSRFTGGDGAPAWTLDAVGFDRSAFHETGAAFLHQVHGDPFPRMIWPTNSTKLAAATMFTLFFAGNDFAPQLRIDGEPVQEYLQRHYIAAIVQVARRLRDLPNVIGYDTLNEPLAGFIGYTNLAVDPSPLKIGMAPTPIQAMAAGMGIAQTVGVWELTPRGAVQRSTAVLNPGGRLAWLPGFRDIWQQHGVWDTAPDGAVRLVRPDYFAQVKGRAVEFSQDYYRPFANRYAAAIREAQEDALIFLETETTGQPPRWTDDDAERIVFAPHWYDILTLLLKRYTPFISFDTASSKLVFGKRAIDRLFARQLSNFQLEARERLRSAPTLLGEIGIPFDLGDRRAYTTGKYHDQIEVADRTMRAVEASLSHITWWNYTADNDHAHGDQWNGEDLSIFSRDDPENGRATSAIVRPYPRALAGELLTLRFNRRSRRCIIRFRHDPACRAPSQIFIPALHYGRGIRVTVTDGTWTYDAMTHMLEYQHGTSIPEHTIEIRPA